MHQVLITGATSGIGRALALKLAEQGAHVFAIGRRMPQLQSLQQIDPNKITIIQADVSLDAKRKQITHVIKQADIKLTHVVHNAGTIEPVARMSNFTLDDYRYQHSVNTEAPLFLTQALLPYIAEGCRFLFITSGAAFKVWEGLGSYSVSKAGVQMVWQAFKQEFAAKDVYFAGLRPGGVDTDLVSTACRYPTDVFPNQSSIRKAKVEGTLLVPKTSAEFIAWVLCATSNDQFEKSWNINDEKDKADWQASWGETFEGS